MSYSIDATIGILCKAYSHSKIDVVFFIRRGKVCFFVLLYVATAQAIIGQLSCFDEIFGCGVGVFGNTEGERCICLENYPETDSLIILAHCA